MLQLHSHLGHPFAGEPEVLRVGDTGTASGMAITTARELITRDGRRRLPEALHYLKSGDIVRVIPSTAEIVVLYRRESPHNSVFLTNRCNSRCVMCSQPPTPDNDDFLVAVWRQAIPLMDPGTRELGISGGEPTLLKHELIELIALLRDALPATAVHVLSNGRLFNYARYSKALGDVAHPDLMIGIPLYSDLASEHNYVVQAERAFDQTLRGIMNLKRARVRVELRVVLHADTVGRLVPLARFICRNLPNVDHVALMGLEQMGFAKLHLRSLYVDPLDYAAQLSEAVSLLQSARLAVSIYNHQLCTLPRDLWPFARRSISDWKNDYVEECTRCGMRDECGGFFSSSLTHRSRGIAPLPERQEEAR